MLILIGVAFLSVGCSKGGGSAAPITPTSMPVAVEGIKGVQGNVQKGPFILGSTVYIQALDDLFNPTGETYLTQTTDDLGSFSLSSTIAAKYLDVIGMGYYYNEVSGDLSDSTISLRSFSEMSTAVNLNLLTTLSNNRIEYLLSHELTSYDTYTKARAQAEKEILGIFQINKDGEKDIQNADGSVLHFDQMDISKAGTSNAILLAISSTLQGQNTVGDLSELISKTIVDVAPDGALNNPIQKEEIKNNGKALSLSEIRTNLADRYYYLGMDKLVSTIPRFEDYIDSDGDDVLNKEDTDTYVWTKTSPYAPTTAEIAANSAAGVASGAMPWGGRSGFAVLVYDNKMWIMGGSGSSKFFNDVWSSSDGAHWTQATASAGWSPRMQFCATVFNGEMWVMGGDDANYQWKSDVWHSKDGMNWTEATNSAAWGNNGNFVCVGFKDELWAIVGTGAWHSTDGSTWTKATDTAGFNGFYAASTVFNDEIWLFGGYNDNYASIWHSADGLNWTRDTDTAVWGKRSGPQAVTFDGKMWILGGGGPFPPHTGEIWYSPDGRDWSQPSAATPFSTVGSIGSSPCVAYNNKLWLFTSTGVWNYDLYSKYVPWMP